MGCRFTHGKKRLYEAAVFFEDDYEDVCFLSSFDRERERERERTTSPTTTTHAIAIINITLLYRFTSCAEYRFPVGVSTETV